MKLKKTIGKWPLSFIVVILSMALLVTPALAAFSTAEIIKQNASNTIPFKVVPSVSGNLAEMYKQDAIALDVTQEFMKKYKCDMENATVRDFDEAYGAGYVGVFFPIKDNTGKSYSFYSVLLNKKDKTLVGTTAVIFNKVGKVYHATVMKDGKEIISSKITEEGKIIEGWGLTPDGSKVDLAGVGIKGKNNVSAQGWWSCFNDCLASQGVAAWAIALLASICGIACAVTVGTGCFVCLGGVTFITSGVIGYCGGYCGGLYW